MVGESKILLRVEHFEQRRGRIAAVVRANFIDFVEHKHGVNGAGAAHGLDNPTRHRADVRAAVPAYFCFVSDAAQRNAHELAAQRLGNGFAERGLASARRADEA